jgi:SEC-C motif-containing protein
MKPLEGCCGPYVEGRAAAPTAEALMRARYTAFVLKKVPYILETHHSKTKEEISEEGVRDWSERAEWLGLEILATEAGGEKDDEGFVRFVARYKEKGSIVNHLEDARFERENGAWRFVTGNPPPAKREAPKVGRNDPCSCGSGKKWKKCCGAKAGA